MNASPDPQSGRATPSLLGGGSRRDWSDEWWRCTVEQARGNAVAAVSAAQDCQQFYAALVAAHAHAQTLKVCKALAELACAAAQEATTDARILAEQCHAECWDSFTAHEQQLSACPQPPPPVEERVQLRQALLQLLREHSCTEAAVRQEAGLAAEWAWSQQEHRPMARLRRVWSLLAARRDSEAGTRLPAASRRDLLQAVAANAHWFCRTWRGSQQAQALMADLQRQEDAERAGSPAPRQATPAALRRLLLHLQVRSVLAAPARHIELRQMAKRMSANERQIGVASLEAFLSRKGAAAAAAAAAAGGGASAEQLPRWGPAATGWHSVSPPPVMPYKRIKPATSSSSSSSSRCSSRCRSISGHTQAARGVLASGFAGLVKRSHVLAERQPLRTGDRVRDGRDGGGSSLQPVARCRPASFSAARLQVAGARCLSSSFTSKSFTAAAAGTSASFSAGSRLSNLGGSIPIPAKSFQSFGGTQAAAFGAAEVVRGSSGTAAALVACSRRVSLSAATLGTMSTGGNSNNSSSRAAVQGTAAEASSSAGLCRSPGLLTASTGSAASLDAAQMEHERQLARVTDESSYAGAAWVDGVDGS